MVTKSICLIALLGITSNSFGMTEFQAEAYKFGWQGGTDAVKSLFKTSSPVITSTGSSLRTAGGLIRDLSIGGLRCAPNISLQTILYWGVLAYMTYRVNRAEGKLDNIDKVTQETKKQVVTIKETVTKTDKTVREIDLKVTDLTKTTNDMSESVEEIKDNLHQHGIHFDALLKGQKKAEKQVSQVQEEQGKMHDTINQVADVLNSALRLITGLGSQVTAVQEGQEIIKSTIQSNHEALEKMGKEFAGGLQKNNEAINKQSEKIVALEKTVSNAGFQLMQLKGFLTTSNNRAITRASSAIGILGIKRPSNNQTTLNINKFGRDKYNKPYNFIAKYLTKSSTSKQLLPPDTYYDLY